MRRSWQQLLRRLALDHRAGASALLAQAIEAGRLFLAATEAEPPARLLRALERFTRRLAASQPSMAPVLTLANAIWLGVEDRPAGTSPWAAMHEALAGYADATDRHLLATVARAARRVRAGSRVLTYSHSTAVRLALWRAVAEGKRFEVVCSESRPMNEGIALARALAERGVSVRLVVDAALPGCLERADLVLLGADAVLPAGVVNKIGTRPLLETARRLRVPAYVLADSTKWLPARLAGFWRMRAEPPREIARLRHPNLRIENRYFDTSPHALLGGVIWEQGIARPGSIRARLTRRRVAAGLVRLLRAGVSGR